MRTFIHFAPVYFLVNYLSLLYLILLLAALLPDTINCGLTTKIYPPLLLLAGLHWACDLEVDAVTRWRRRDEWAEPADVPAGTQGVAQVAQQAQGVGPAAGVPLPGGLALQHQEDMEEEEGGDQQEAHHTGVCDEGKGKGPRCNLAWDQHDPGDEQQQHAMQRHPFLQDDDEDLGVHYHGVQQPRPHEEQAAQEKAVVTKANALTKEHTVVVSP